MARRLECRGRRTGYRVLPILLLNASLLTNNATAALHPPGGQAGTTIEVLATGKHEDWPPQFWSADPGLEFEALEKKGQLKITIAKDAQPGPTLVRLLGKKEISAPYTFVVSKQKETLETEPNNHIAKAQEIKAIPTLINGRLEKTGDTDFFHVHLEKGQTLSAQLDGYSLHSPIDPFLHIHDPHGYETAVASDTHNLDPHLVYTTRKTGRHTLQVLAVTAKATSKITYAGAEDAVYRLRLSIGKPTSEPPPADHTEDNCPDQIPIPGTLAGQLSKPGEKDTYFFKAEKGSSVQIRVEAHSLHFPTDVVLAIYNSAGSLVREVDDDKKNRDPAYLLKVNSNDTFSLKITDRYGRSGDNFRYRVVLKNPQPDFSPTVAKDTHTVETGKELEIKIPLNRKNSHALLLSAELLDFPEGFRIEGHKIPGDSKEATIKIAANADAPVGHHPFQIRITEASQNIQKTKLAIHSFQTNTSRGDYLINETTWLWLTVREKKKKEDKKDK